MKKTIHWLRNNLFLLLFFATISASAFLGDGRQSVNDAVIEIGIVVLFGLSLWRTKKISIPKFTHSLWVVLLAYLFMRSITSISIGDSLYVFVRYLSAYLVFLVFSSLCKKAWPSLFSTFLLVSGVVFILISFFLARFPLPYCVPPVSLMSLLCSRYGHSQIVILVVFLFPLVYARFFQKQNLINSFLLLLLLVTSMISFSRGAIFILGGFLLWKLLQTKKSEDKKRVLLPTSLFALLLVGFLVMQATSLGWLGHTKWWMGGIGATEYAQKSLLFDDGRVTYWKQAVQAFETRPLFGYGPGTFFLLSKRLQGADHQIAWFTHSLALQTLAEFGAVGNVLFFGLVIGIFYWIRKHSEKLSDIHSYQQRALFEGACISLFYGFVDYSFDFLVVWLLWWAILGLLIGIASEDIYRFSNRVAVKIFGVFCAIIVLFFGTLSVSGYLLAKIGKTHDSLFVAPFSVDVVTKFFRDIPSAAMTTNEKQRVLFFHKQDADVLFSLAGTGGVGSAELYKKAVQEDPQNEQYLDGYFQSLLKKQDERDVWPIIRDESLIIAPDYIDQINEIDKRIRGLGYKILPNFPRLFVLQDPQRYLYLSKLYYFMGLQMIGKNAYLTEKMWYFAKNLSPNWSFYYFELASLEQYILQNTAVSKTVLSDCNNHAYTRAYCSLFTIQNLRPVGSFTEEILAIPIVSRWK